MSKLEQIIAEIEDLIDNSKPVPFSNNKVSVSKDILEELLRELRLRIPDEIKKYQRLISNKEAILAEAKDQAASIIDEAKVHTQELVNEHEIMQRAYAEAEEIKEQAYVQAQEHLDRAIMEANQMRMSAVQYTDEMLANLQMIIEHSIDSNRAKYEGLLNSLDKDLNVVIANRRELSGINEQAEDDMMPENEIEYTEDEEE